MPHDITWLNISVIYRRILLFLHIAQSFQDLGSHLVNLVNRKTQVTSCIILQVFTFKQLHQCVEQSLLSSVVKFELNNVGVVERF